MATQVTSWSSMSQAEFKGIFDRTWETFIDFDAKFQKEGKQVFYDDMRTIGTPEELAFSKKVADFIVSIHSSPKGNAANPYAGASREMLTSIMYDESGRYTASERYAATSEQQKQDFTYFSGLSASASITSDYREYYKGVLDYYDALSPVEASVYPKGYREQVEGYLKQQETLFGVLSDQDSDARKRFFPTKPTP